ncbi:MAG: LysR family transcriptional regulator [Candidatus Sericytochromatia bacterium]
MPLNADQLDAFWMVVQQGGFHKAAEALYITQSAVTQRVQALEAAVGQKLFLRSPRGVTLTPAGQRMVRYCREQREAEQALLASLEGSQEGLMGRLAVAAPTIAGRAWVLQALVALGRAHPRLDLALTLGDDLAPLQLLESSQVDAVLGEAHVSRQGIHSVRIGAMPFVMVATPEATEAWGETPTREQLVALRAIDFHPEDRVTLDHLALCLPGADLGGLRRHFVNDDLGILAWVLAGAGFSVLPRPIVEPALAEGRLRAFFPAVRQERALYLSFAEGVAPVAIAAFAEALAGSSNFTFELGRT